MPEIELSLAAIDERYSRLRMMDQRRETQLMASLEERGQQEAILVVSEGGRYVLVDGRKRVRALRRLRHDTVKAIVSDMPVEEALASAYRAASGPGYNAIEEGWLVYELHRVDKWDLGKVAEGLGRSKSWASRRLALVEQLPDWVAQDIAEGKIGAHAASTYLAPLTRVNGEGRQLAEKLRGLELSDRQLKTVCDRWREAPGAVRRKIAEDPARFLAALEAAGKGADDPTLSEAENRALKQLELIGNVALGLARSLPKLMGYDTNEQPRSKLWTAWECAAEKIILLQHTAEALKAAGKTKEESKDAQSRNTDGDIDAARSGTWQPQDRPGVGGEPLGGAGGDRQPQFAAAASADPAAPA